MIYNGNYISDNNSYSLLKKFDDEGPRGLLSKKDETGDLDLKYGSLLDDYIFLDKEKFDKTYKLINISLPPALSTLAREVKKKFKKEDIDKITDSDKLKEKVVNIIKNLSLYGNIKNKDTFIKKFDIEDFYEYCKELYDNKILIDIQEMIKAKEGKASLYTNTKTSEYFTNKHENIYQLEIKFDYLNSPMKCFLDMVIIDHDKKIIKGIDLKTGSPSSEEFMFNFFKYKYYLQAAIYNLALENYNKEHFDGKYKVDKFRFIYLCKYDIDNPIVYVVSDKWIECAINGFKTISGFNYRGVKQLVEEISWHRDNKVFNLSREAFLNKEIFLDDNFIKKNGR